jgi:hypothetical protein
MNKSPSAAAITTVATASTSAAEARLQENSRNWPPDRPGRLRPPDQDMILGQHYLQPASSTPSA